MYNVERVFKGHSNQRKCSDQGKFSSNSILSSMCKRTCDEGTLVMLGHFLWDIEMHFFYLGQVKPYFSFLRCVLFNILFNVYMYTGYVTKH